MRIEYAMSSITNYNGGVISKHEYEHVYAIMPCYKLHSVQVEKLAWRSEWKGGVEGVGLQTLVKG